MTTTPLNGASTPQGNHPATPLLQGIDYIELYVGNAQQAAHFYRTSFGFTLTAYAGPETGVRDWVSYVVEQGSIRLVFTSAIDGDHPIAQHVALHGDGVKDVAFNVTNTEQIFQLVVSAGAKTVAEPTTIEEERGQVQRATIAAFGDTVHSFIQRDAYAGTFLPKYHKITQQLPVTPVGFSEIDHVAICLEAGTLDQWAEFYRNALGFYQLHEENIETEHSAMNSKAVADSSGRIKFPMQEPAPNKSKHKSQIEEYLSSHSGPGVQHIAVLTENIVESIRALRSNGIDFRKTPGTYYDMLPERVGAIKEDLEALRELNILVDRDEWGYLLQIFAKPVQSRPTLFAEIIQRDGARGFGSGNIKALFQSIEREQMLRNSL